MVDFRLDLRCLPDAERTLSVLNLPVAVRAPDLSRPDETGFNDAVIDLVRAGFVGALSWPQLAELVTATAPADLDYASAVLIGTHDHHKAARRRVFEPIPDALWTSLSRPDFLATVHPQVAARMAVCADARGSEGPAVQFLQRAQCPVDTEPFSDISLMDRLAALWRAHQQTNRLRRAVRAGWTHAADVLAAILAREIEDLFSEDETEAELIERERLQHELIQLALDGSNWGEFSLQWMAFESDDDALVAALDEAGINTAPIARLRAACFEEPSRVDELDYFATERPGVDLVQAAIEGDMYGAGFRLAQDASDAELLEYSRAGIADCTEELLRRSIGHRTSGFTITDAGLIRPTAVVPIEGAPTGLPQQHGAAEVPNR